MLRSPLSPSAGSDAPRFASRRRWRQRGFRARTVWAPSRIRRIVRHRATSVLAVVVIAGVAANLISTRAQALDQARADWGQASAILVMSEPVAAGEPISGRYEVRAFPSGLVPPGALVAETELDAGARARVRLYPGEVLIEDRVSSSLGDLAPPGTAVLTLPVLTAVPMLEVSALVDVWMVDSANLSSRRVAQAVTVLSIDGDAVTVAVPEADVAQATAASLRPVTITLVG